MIRELLLLIPVCILLVFFFSYQRIRTIFYGFDKRLAQKGVSEKKKSNKCHWWYNWLWNCKCLIAYTFRVSLLGFSVVIILVDKQKQPVSIRAQIWFKGGDGNSEGTNNKTPIEKMSDFLFKKTTLLFYSTWKTILIEFYLCLHIWLSVFLQLQWNVYPICHLPASLRGKPISDLNATVLAECMDIDSNDLYDIAGISENILLMRGNGFWEHFRKITFTHMMYSVHQYISTRVR